MTRFLLLPHSRLKKKVEKRDNFSKMSFFKPKNKGGASVNPAADGSAASSAPPRLVPWVEKYRPRSVEAVLSQEETTRSLRGAISGGKIPHLLFYGPPGTGKTSTILALTRELFGAPNTSLYKKRVLELNASDERGISVVRERVKRFANLATSKNAKRADGTFVPPLKIIILDEVDSMTGDAQSALRRTIEKYTHVTRFCLICNYVSRIIEPLASRCAKFRFSELSSKSVRQKLDEVCAAEKITCQEGAIETIMRVSGGDMRKAITVLQSSAVYTSNNVTADVVYDTSGQIPETFISKVWAAIKSCNFESVAREVDDIVAEGYSATILLLQMNESMLKDADLSDQTKSAIAIKIAEADLRLQDGASERLQVGDVCAHAMQQVSLQK